jgi:hypothetical protein
MTLAGAATELRNMPIQGRQRSSQLRAALLGAMTLALVMAIVLDLQSISVSTSFPLCAALVSTLVPAINRMSAYMVDSDSWITTATVNWAFFPVYIGILFWMAPPWSASARARAREKGASISGGARIAVLVVSLVLVLMILSDLRLLSAIPTLANGGLVIPSNNTGILVDALYRSHAYLFLYAWVTPCVEAIVWWVGFFFFVNWKAYFVGSPKSS